MPIRKTSFIFHINYNRTVIAHNENAKNNKLDK